MAKKDKKQKIRYIDDGSTVSDMSGVGRGGATKPPKSKEKQKARPERLARSSGREIFRTYIESVKLMFFPMLAVLGLLAIAFALVYLIF